MGFKITLITAGIGIIFAKLDVAHAWLIVIPAVASFFFDVMVHSYSFAIKRTGAYCRVYLEPIFRAEYKLGSDFKYWEQFMNSEDARRKAGIGGNVGLKVLTMIAAGIACWWTLDSLIALLTIFVLFGMVGYDIYLVVKDPLKDLKKDDVDGAALSGTG